MAAPAIRRYLRHGMLPQLRLFEATARLGSYARAAEELHMAQPTASLQMKKLTETVGVPLFEPGGKRVQLTEGGRLLLEACHQVFAALESLDEQLAGLRPAGAGRLRLAVSTTAMSFAPRLAGAFLEHYPGVEIALHAGNRQVLLARLRDNVDDLYVFADAPESEQAVVQELIPNPLVVLARDDHPLAARRDIAFAELAREPFLLREEGSGLRRQTMRLFDRHGLAPRARLELGSNEAVKEAILAGLGVTIAPRYTFGLDPESTRYVCLDVAGFPVENHWWLAYRSGKQLGATARAFVDFCRAEARDIARVSLSAATARA